MVQVLIAISLEVLLQKETWGYAKVLKKNGHKDVRNIENNGYKDACLKNIEKKIAPTLTKIFPSFKKDMISRRKVELGFHHIHYIYPHICTS